MHSVAFFIASLRGGGAEQTCISLANALHQQNWKVAVWKLNQNSNELDDQLNDEIALYQLPAKSVKYAILNIRSHLLRYPPKIIVIFGFDLIFPTILALTLLKIKPKVVFRNSNTLSVEMANKKSKWFERMALTLAPLFLKRINLIIHQSKQMAEDFIQLYPNCSSTFKVIHNPIKTTLEVLDEPKEKIFLMVGRLEKQKAHHLGIQAFEIFNRTHKGYRLVIMGSGNRFNELNAMAQFKGLEQNVLFLPFTSAISKWYLRAQAVLLTSLYEGFPNVLIESISLGTPIVAFDSPSGPSEIIIEGRNGYLIPQGDVEKMAQKMGELVEHPLDVHQIKLTADRFDIAAILPQYENAFLSLF